MIGFSLVVFISVFLRLAYQWSTYRSLDAPEKSAYRASIAVATFNLLFVVLFALAMQDQQALTYNITTLLKISLVLPILATIATLYHIYQSIKIWRRKLCSTPFTRIRYNIITLCAISTVWFYHHWNLLGFKYFSD